MTRSEQATRQRPLAGDEPAGNTLNVGESCANIGDASAEGGQPAAAPREIGGRQGPDPTRYGDWELKGRCIDF